MFSLNTLLSQGVWSLWKNWHFLGYIPMIYLDKDLVAGKSHIEEPHLVKVIVLWQKA